MRRSYFFSPPSIKDIFFQGHRQNNAIKILATFCGPESAEKQAEYFNARLAEALTEVKTIAAHPVELHNLSYRTVQTIAVTFMLAKCFNQAPADFDKIQDWNKSWRAYQHAVAKNGPAHEQSLLLKEQIHKWVIGDFFSNCMEVKTKRMISQIIGVPKGSTSPAPC